MHGHPCSQQDQQRPLTRRHLGPLWQPARCHGLCVCVVMPPAFGWVSPPAPTRRCGSPTLPPAVQGHGQPLQVQLRKVQPPADLQSVPTGLRAGRRRRVPAGEVVAAAHRCCAALCSFMLLALAPHHPLRPSPAVHRHPRPRRRPPHWHPLHRLLCRLRKVQGLSVSAGCLHRPADERLRAQQRAVQPVPCGVPYGAGRVRWDHWRMHCLQPRVWVQRHPQDVRAGEEWLGCLGFRFWVWMHEAWLGTEHWGHRQWLASGNELEPRSLNPLVLSPHASAVQGQPAPAAAPHVPGLRRRHRRQRRSLHHRRRSRRVAWGLGRGDSALPPVHRRQLPGVQVGGGAGVRRAVRVQIRYGEGPVPAVPARLRTLRRRCQCACPTGAARKSMWMRRQASR